MLIPTNIWPVLKWRDLRNWLLQEKMYRGWSQDLLDKKRVLVSAYMPTPEHPQGLKMPYAEKRRLTHYNYWLGSGGWFYNKPRSPAQYLRESRVTDRIISKILAESEATDDQAVCC